MVGAVKHAAAAVVIGIYLSQMPLSVLALLSVKRSQGATVVANEARRDERRDLSDDVVNFINSNVDPNNLRDNLRFLSSRPHEAGTEAEAETAEWVAGRWREYGLDAVQMVPYSVLLSYPDGPNLVRLLDASSGSVLAENSPKQKPLYAPEESSEEVPFSFNAYAATGNVTGAVVYANYGREEDYAYLVDSGVDIAGKIVIARYGMIFRANMVSFAEQLGAAGVLLYTDPADYAIDGPDSVYPHSVMMPPSGTQLGTVKLTDGDPLTPFYPSIESAFHIPEEEAAIPKIPVQPLSYEDAYFVLSSLGGPPAPASWAGALNLTYRVGLTDPSYVVNMDVHTHNVPAVIHDVIGVIEGAEEPDRYVMLGNHRDAWVFGAIDPSSGTAAMVELARVLSVLRNETGWRPRRSIVLCSWAAEEYGLVGSVEFTEQFSRQLQDRAVAYLNMDLAIVGNYSLKVLSAPMLYDVVWQAAKLVPNPDPAEAAAGRPTVYDTWLARKPDPSDSTRPEIELVASGSDYRGFIHSQGVTSCDFSYNHDESIPGWYPLYHSLYETFALVDELYDQGFFFQAAVTKLWTIVAVSLSDPQVLPFSLSEYSRFISSVQQQISDEFGELMTDNNRTFVFSSSSPASEITRTASEVTISAPTHTASEVTITAPTHTASEATITAPTHTASGGYNRSTHTHSLSYNRSTHTLDATNTTDMSIPADQFLAAGATFATRVQEFELELQGLDLNDVLAVRRANDQQMLVERSFLDPRGLPDRPDFNHVVLAPSASDAYTGTAFSGITDALNAISLTDDPAQLQVLWRTLDEHLAAVISLIYSAANSLTLSLW